MDEENVVVAQYPQVVVDYNSHMQLRFDLGRAFIAAGLAREKLATYAPDHPALADMDRAIEILREVSSLTFLLTE